MGSDIDPAQSDQYDQRPGDPSDTQMGRVEKDRPRRAIDGVIGWKAESLAATHDRLGLR